MRHLPLLLFTAAVLALDWVFIRWVLLANPPNADVSARVAIGLVLALVTVLAVAGLVRAIAAAVKGTLKVRFTDRPYTWGEEIEGSVELCLRQRLVVERLTVTLIAERRVSGGEDDSDHRQTVVQIEQDLLASEPLLPGKHAYAFVVRIPEKPSAANDTTSFALPEGLGKVMSSLIKLAASSALGGTLHWELRTQLHTEGADLSDERPLRFNQTQI